MDIIKSWGRGNGWNFTVISLRVAGWFVNRRVVDFTVQARGYLLVLKTRAFQRSLIVLVKEPDNLLHP